MPQSELVEDEAGSRALEFVGTKQDLIVVPSARHLWMYLKLRLAL